jgi:hypothetical protein
MADVHELAEALGMSSKQLASLSLKFAKEHGELADEKLHDYLTGLERETRDEPRLLRATPPTPRKRDNDPPGPAEVIEAAEASAYTNNSYQALRDEPEAVPAQVQRRYTAEAHARAAETPHAQKREARSIAQQVRQATAEAHKKGVDVTPHLAKIRTELDAMKRVA